MSDTFRITPPPVDPNESRDVRIKRLRMRSMRRGIKEMDLILSAFAEADLDGMDPAELDVFEAILHENDQDLYVWVTGQAPAPEQFSEMISRISGSIHRA